MVGHRMPYGRVRRDVFPDSHLSIYRAPNVIALDELPNALYVVDRTPIGTAMLQQKLPRRPPAAFHPQTLHVEAFPPPSNKQHQIEEVIPITSAIKSSIDVSPLFSGT